VATHRRPRPRARILPGSRAALGLTAAALATVTLLGENATAASAAGPAKQPTIKQVQAKVDSLYHQADSATQRYDAAKQRTDKQRKVADTALEKVAQKTQKLNDARREVGEYAALTYRTGGIGQTAAYLLTPDPGQLLENQHVLGHLSASQEHAFQNFQDQQSSVVRNRQKAVKSLDKLTTEQHKLGTAKKSVQAKLTAARKLLNSLTAAQRARLAKLQAQQEKEARKKAAAIAAAQKKAQQNTGGASTSTGTGASTNTGSGASTGSGTSTGTGSGSSGGSGSAAAPSAAWTARAAKAVAFERAQLGKPYVWGATGPNSYDCSGLTQAAWKAAGVSIPRTTGEQVNFGTRITQDELRPGDLIFFYSDASHVGMYIGNGEMIHAPHTGTVVKIAPMTEMPIYGYARMP
jgi:cell wall-associated NlpC family hydrolase